MIGSNAEIRAEVESRVITLTHLIPSLSYWSVWDLPWSVWAGYREFVDEYLKARAGRG